MHARSTERLPISLFIVLLIALIHGAVYVFLAPLWAHYDEPNHFEYVWWVANQHALLKSGDYDPGMRLAVAQSMISHDFYKGQNSLPDLKKQPIYIGAYSQADHPPLYYILASLPLWLYHGGIGHQLILTRLVSLGMFLFTILMAWVIVRELASPGNPLRWMLPLSLALLPAFVDLMTAVNSDVGAVAFFSLFIWTVIVLVKRGFSWKFFWLAILSTGLCMLIKRTTYIALPLLLLGLVFSVFRHKLRIWAWGLIVMAIFLGLVACFKWGDAFLWYRMSDQQSSTRVVVDNAPAGRYAFRLEAIPGKAPPKLVQILPWQEARKMQGETFTIGAWVWASQSIRARSPALTVFAGNQVFYKTIQLDQTPQFVTFQAQPQGDTTRMWLSFEPLTITVSSPVTFYADGISMVAGQFTGQDHPSYTDASAETGIWNGQQYDNLIRQASAEVPGPSLRSWADRLGASIFFDFGFEKGSLAIYALMDQRATGWYFSTTARELFRSFWAQFGWGQLNIIAGDIIFPVLLGFTVLGILLAFANLFSKRKMASAELIFFTGCIVLGVWGLAFVRGSNYVFSRAGFYPKARYAFPAIIPTMLVLNLGWLQLSKWLSKSVKIQKIMAGLYIFLFASLDVISMITIYLNYHG